jgi:cycloeucalenol cycloisomerase
MGETAMTSAALAQEADGARTFTSTRKWFSENDDKAWGEKLYISYIPFFLVFNAVLQKMGWTNPNNFWNVMQGVLLWIPYCVAAPLVLRRNQAIPVYRQWWFKCQVYLGILTLFMTYFHTEYFFDVLGMRYNYPRVTLYLDSVLLGPNQAHALAQHARIPIGMYLTTMGFFTVYHVAAVVMIRRVYNLAKDLAGSGAVAVHKAAFALTVLAAALFFACMETILFVSGSSLGYAWYVDLHRQLYVGSCFYAMDFIFTFPNLYGLDERRDQPAWTISKVVVNAAAMCMFVLLADDLWTQFYGAPFKVW